MSTTLFTTAYAGHADVTPENVAAILDQTLPQALGMVYIPTLPKRVPSGHPPQKGLRAAIDWLTKEVGESGTIPVDDVIQALLDRNSPEAIEADKARGEDEPGYRDGPDELVLVIAYDPESEADAELALAAHQQGIRVVNLAAAGDDIVFEDETVAEAEELPPFEGGTPIEETPGVKEQIEAAKAAGLDAAKAVREASEAAGLLPPRTAHTESGFAVQVTINIPPEALQVLAQILGPQIVAAMGAQAQAAVASAPGENLATVTHLPVGGEAKPGAGTVAYYYDGDKGTYRPARGKARESEQKVSLTPEEVAEIREKKLLA